MQTEAFEYRGYTIAPSRKWPKGHYDCSGQTFLGVDGIKRWINAHRAREWAAQYKPISDERRFYRSWGK